MLIIVIIFSHETVLVLLSTLNTIVNQLNFKEFFNNLYLFKVFMYLFIIFDKEISHKIYGVIYAFYATLGEKQL
jgi:hypothetical protein